MMRLAILAVLVLQAAALRADVAMSWSRATATIVVAHDDRIESFDRTGEKRLWSAKGLASPSAIVTSPDEESAAILDGFADRVAVVSVADGAVKLYETPATPVAAVFFGPDLWVVLRDRSRVLRITPEGQRTEVAVALDPALIAAGARFVYVYSRAQGLLQEIDPNAAQVTRSALVGAAGSDLEIRLPRAGEAPRERAYLCRPMHGKVVTIDLVSMESREKNAGSTPIDLAFDPTTSVIADPGRQLLDKSSDPGSDVAIKLPTPADRVSITAAGVFAFDTGSGTIYRVELRTATKIASVPSATSFVATDDALFIWDAKAGRPRVP